MTQSGHRLCDDTGKPSGGAIAVKQQRDLFDGVRPHAVRQAFLPLDPPDRPFLGFMGHIGGGRGLARPRMPPHYRPPVTLHLSAAARR